MNNIVFSFIITTLAGLSTLLGFLFIFINKDKEKLLTASISFAAGIMVTISFVDLIPSAYTYLNTKYFSYTSILLVLLAILIGITISSLLDKYLPTKNSDNIYHLGILTMIVIILHNMPEGIVTFISSTNNISLGISLSIAIALHNIPEGISISYPIFYSTKSKTKAFLYTLLAGFSEPLGALLAYIFLRNIVTYTFLGILLGIIAGIMIYISVYEFLPNAISKRNNKVVYISFISGILIFIISHLI